MRTRLIIGATLGISVFLILVPYVGDNDFWFHLRTGQVMFEDGVFPRSELFSFTALGTPWVNHEYGAQLAFYGAYTLFGFPGVALMTAMVGVVFFMLLIGRAGVRSVPVVILTLAAAYGLQPFFVPRPQILAYVLLSALILVVRRYARSGEQRFLLALPAIMLVWGNIHASVVIALGVYGAAIAAHLVRPYLLSPRRFFVFTGVSIVASLANPFGWQVYGYALQPLRHREAYHMLIETRPIWEHLTRSPIAVAFALHGMFGLFLLWHALRPALRVRVLLFEYLLFGGVFLAPFFSVKYLPFAWAVMVPIVISAISKQKIENSRRNDTWALGIAGAGLVIALGVFFTRGNLWRDAHGEWPKDMAAFIAGEVRGNIYNPYSWGGYLIWQNQSSPVFIDGRFEMFADRVYWDALAFEDGERIDEIVRQYDLSAAIARPWTTLAYTLSLHEDWALVYWDNFGMVYVRRGVANDVLIRRYGMAIPYINDSMEGILRKVPGRQLPVLVAAYEEAVRRQPDLLLGRFRLGLLYQAAKRCDLAVPQWEAVVAIGERLGAAHGKLAECALALGDRERALREAALSKKHAKRQRWWYGRY